MHNIDQCEFVTTCESFAAQNTWRSIYQRQYVQTNDDDDELIFDDVN